MYQSPGQWFRGEHSNLCSRQGQLSVNPRLSSVHVLATSILVFLFGSLSFGAEFYVSPHGNDDDVGSLAQPFASLARAQDAVSPGDTVWIRGGTYQFSSGPNDNGSAVEFTKSGTAGNRINYWAYPGEKPVFDFSGHLPEDRVRGFSVRSDYLHFRGLEITGVKQVIPGLGIASAAIRLEGSGGADFNIFEQLDIHHNEGLGYWNTNGGHNLVLNTDSHHNYDPTTGGENADGFCSRTNQPGNVFLGTRAWHNSDDGYDFIHSPGAVLADESWAWHNGYIPDTNIRAGNGSGFKAGGFALDPSRFPAPNEVPRHRVINSIAFDNRAHGFYANHHPGGLDFINNTAFDNNNGFNLLNDVLIENWPADHFLRNNISFDNNNDLANAIQALIDDEFNTWNAGFDVNAADFLSLDSTGVDGPRNADGSLPVLYFLRLAEGSSLIDAGVNVSQPFLGFAPEVGAFEFDVPPPLAGDVDRDGDVDLDDFQLISMNLQNSVVPGSTGDLSADGIVDFDDFRIWKANYQPQQLADALSIPEPLAISLSLVSLAACTVARQRNA